MLLLKLLPRTALPQRPPLRTPTLPWTSLRRSCIMDQGDRSQYLKRNHFQPTLFLRVKRKAVKGWLRIRRKVHQLQSLRQAEKNWVPLSRRPIL